MKIDIIEDDILSYSSSLLKILLKDQTTGINIVWATNDYEELGLEFLPQAEIKIDFIVGIHKKIIQPRVTKAKLNQSNRTREKAEVFTPSWICNEQNNLIDERWFERENVFNISGQKNWKTNKHKIEFPNTRGKTWQDYVDTRRMEITCGEAPYLVSRYDTVSGKSIDVSKRVGLLDRKLRVINENTDDESDWFKWVIRAYQSIYGYEFQGDNLLLARENLLYTFIDNLEYKFGKKAELNELKKIANIISWNIWQMDGLTFTAPYSQDEKVDVNHQISFFDNLDEEIKPEYVARFCVIKDWRAKHNVEYRTLLQGEK
jgi:hypothetical protein